MRLERFTGVGEFAARVEPYLLAHEATHCLMLGLLSTLPRGPQPADETPYMALVEEQAAIVMVTMRTPPFNLILSLIAPEFAANTTEAMALIADDVRACYRDALPGVLAPVPVARLFAEGWQRQAGLKTRLLMKERIYELEAVIPVTNVAGSFRCPTRGDRDLMIRWLAAFGAEAMPDDRQFDGAEWVERFFTTPSRGGYIWENDGVPVSLVAYGNPTTHGIRIGPVYTPPEHRGHGYASACVAALSQHLLESGRTFCFLFTDLANPTSNHIYQAIGYNPVNDVDVYTFDTER